METKIKYFLLPNRKGSMWLYRDSEVPYVLDFWVECDCMWTNAGWNKDDIEGISVDNIPDCLVMLITGQIV